MPHAIYVIVEINTSMHRLYGITKKNVILFQQILVTMILYLIKNLL